MAVESAGHATKLLNHPLTLDSDSEEEEEEEEELAALFRDMEEREEEGEEVTLDLLHAHHVKRLLMKLSSGERSLIQRMSNDRRLYTHLAERFSPLCMHVISFYFSFG